VATLLTLPPGVPAQPADAVRQATETVMRQLEAFRRDDFDTAYTVASAAIRERFDREAFERMVRGGYPEIARSADAVVAGSRVTPGGDVYLRLRIRGANGNRVEAVYELVPEGPAFRINGVLTRPDPGAPASFPLTPDAPADYARRSPSSA
jgi:hypothetical protein